MARGGDDVSLGKPLGDAHPMLGSGLAVHMINYIVLAKQSFWIHIC